MNDDKNQALELTPAERAQIEKQRTATTTAVQKIDPSMQRTARLLLEAGVEVGSASSKPKPKLVVKSTPQHFRHTAGHVMAALATVGVEVSRADVEGPSLVSRFDHASNVVELELLGVDDLLAFPEPKK